MKWKPPSSGDDKGKRASGSDATERRDKPPAEGIRSAPSPRLQWPARDDQRPKKVTYYGGGEPSSDRTQLYDPTKPGGTKVAAATHGDPVVGWLVIVEGPGKGRSVEIGIGSNAIGRDARQKIALNFGDEAIHREKHAMIVFDPKSRRFYLQAGNDLRNLTYLGDTLVLAPVELNSGDIVLIGQTKLVFVAFCGPEFCWS